MLTNFKLQIESKLGSKVENSELLKAIEMAKNDVVSNKLVTGQNVTAEYFQEIVCKCIRILRMSSLSRGSGLI